ncbi:MAG: SIS domain-containing protein [Enterocloster bolteae]
MQHCQFAFMKFCRLGIPCSSYSDVMLQYTIADNLGPGDVALAVSYEGRSRNVVQAMKIAKKRGATTISITKMNKSPLLRYTDIPLFISISDLTVGRDKVTRRVADQFILDVLYLGYITKKKQDFQSALRGPRAQLTVIKSCRRIRHVLFGTVGLRGGYYAAGTAAACDGKSRRILSPCGYHGWQFCP